MQKEFELVTINSKGKILTSSDEVLFDSSDFTTLSNRLDEVFQSVSEGKALIASAITDKGVTTAADATFQTMADNINSIESNVGIFLGTSTNKWDVKNYYPNYANLSADNFYIGVQSMNSCYGANTTDANPDWYRAGKNSGFTLNKKYDASAGILTVAGNTCTTSTLAILKRDSGNQLDKGSSSVTITCFAVLVK